jgi:hypothetical protein
MHNWHYREHQQRCKEHLEATEHAYVFRPKSGIYEPRSAHPDSQAEHSHPGARPETPLFTNPKTDWRPHVFTWLIGIITLGTIGWYTYVTQGIFHMSEVGTVGTIEAARAARDAADIANAALEDSRKKWEIENRPNLSFIPDDARSILPAKFWGQGVPINTIAVSVAMVNQGRTPAVEFRGPQPIMILSTSDTPPTSHIDTHVGAGETIGVGPPARVTTAYNSFPIPPTTLREIQTGTQFLYVLGGVEYASQYGTSYCASFCFRYNPDGLPFRPCSAPITSCKANKKP